MRLRTITTWHKTKFGYLIFGIVELAAAYFISLLAVNSGNLWEYVLTLLFLYGGLRNLVNIFLKPKKT